MKANHSKQRAAGIILLLALSLLLPVVSAAPVISFDRLTYFDFADSSQFNFNRTRAFSAFSFDNDWAYFGANGVRIYGANVTVHSFYEYDWLNYTVSNALGTQLFYHSVSPTEAYLDGVLSSEGDGWTYNEDTDIITVQGAVATAHFYFGRYVDELDVWYFRSDTHNIQGQLGYKLMPVDSFQYTSVNSSGASVNVVYGIRMWYYNKYNASTEITSGIPDAQVTLTLDTDGVEEFKGYFDCPKLPEIADSVKVIVYSSADDGAWVAKAIYLTSAGYNDDQNYLAVYNCTAVVHYWLSYNSTAETSTFYYGDGDGYNSYISMNVERADPWRIADAKIVNRDLYGFLAIPWTWFLGNFFWTLLLLMCISGIYMKQNSFKLIILLCWIFGGSGSLLWAMIPSVGLVSAALMLAFAMAGSLYKLFYR